MQKVHNNVPTKQGCVQIGAVGIYIDVLDDFYLEVGRTNVYFKVEEELSKAWPWTAFGELYGTRKPQELLIYTFSALWEVQCRHKMTETNTQMNAAHAGKDVKKGENINLPLLMLVEEWRIGSMLKNLSEDSSLDANTHTVALRTISAFWLNMYAQQLVSAVI